MLHEVKFNVTVAVFTSNATHSSTASSPTPSSSSTNSFLSVLFVQMQLSLPLWSFLQFVAGGSANGRNNVTAAAPRLLISWNHAKKGSSPSASPSATRRSLFFPSEPSREILSKALSTASSLDNEQQQPLNDNDVDETKATRVAPSRPFVRLVPIAAESEGKRSGNEELQLLKEVEEGLLVGHAPELCAEGEGGTYFLRNGRGDKVAVFKPRDEDPQALNNPKRKEKQRGSEGGGSNCSSPDSSTGGESGEGGDKLRLSIPAGGTAIREVAAFVLDERQRFANVPQTLLVELSHPCFTNGEEEEEETSTKVGSLQRFIANGTASWDLPPHFFDVEDVQRIAVFDLRAVNTDRHGGNILAVPVNNENEEENNADDDEGDAKATPNTIRRRRFRSKSSNHTSSNNNGGKYKLYPIDHGFAFPTSLEDLSYFEWMYWPQARKPFTPEVLDYILHRIDAEEDARRMRALGLCERAVRVQRVCTTVLKMGADYGLTLYQIASLLCRKKIDEPSSVERILLQLQQEGEEEFWKRLEEEVESLVMSQQRPPQQARTPPRPQQPQQQHQGRARSLSAAPALYCIARRRQSAGTTGQ
ncbi:1-phosphatidylinositol 4-kinase [Balamuthia mandrillaris]